MRRLRSRRRLALGTGTLLVMGLLLLIYALLHSPVRRLVWDAVFGGGCAMFCRVPRLGSEVIDAVGATWFIGVALLAAVPLAGRLMRGGLERIVAAGLLAYGLIVIPAAIVGYAGDLVGIHLLKPPVGPLLASLPAVLILGLSVARGWRPSWPRGETGVTLTPALVILTGLVVASMVISIGFTIRYPISGFDDLGYHAPLSVLYWHEGSLTTFLDRFGSSPVLSHPGGAELWQGLLLLIGGEPLAIVGQLPFALLAGAGVVLFGRRLGLRTGAGVFAALLFLLAPIVTSQSGHVRNDLIGAAVLVATVALITDRTSDRLPARIVLGCLGAALLMVTKLVLLPFAAGLVIVVLFLVWVGLREGGSRRAVWTALGAGVVIGLLTVAPWWVRNLVRDGQPFFPANLPLIGGGFAAGAPPDTRYVPSFLLWPFYPLQEKFGPADGYGGAFAVGIVPGVVAALFLARRRPLAALGVMVLMFVPVWLFLDRREPRFSLGLVALGCALIPFALVALRKRWRNLAVAMLVGIATFTAGVQWLTMSPDQAVERLAYYDRTWGTDPAANALPESVGILVDDRCGGQLGRLYPWFGAGQQRRVARVGCKDVTADDVLRLMRRERLSHVALFIPEADAAARIATLYPPGTFTELSRSMYVNDEATRLRVLLRWDDAPPDPGQAEDDARSDTETGPGD